jgi:predicted Rossmann fold nucleotide-binding protein DprA/Smf involved in DNA uptake
MRTTPDLALPLRLTPERLPDALAGDFPKPTALGNPALLDCLRLALFCSNRCPGGLILAAQDVAYGLRRGERAIVGGFHTPVERECLRILLGGAAPLIICPARGLEGMRVPVAWRVPLAEGRLLVLSPFDGKLDRPTEKVAAERNRFVAALADETLFVHAAAGGRSEALAREMIGAGRSVYTLAHEANRNLFELGALGWG